MKIVKIKTLNPYKNAGEEKMDFVKSISLPSDIVSFESSFGLAPTAPDTFGGYVLGHIFKMSDNTYGAIYIDLLYDAQLMFNAELIKFIKDTKEEDGGGTDDYKEYFE